MMMGEMIWHWLEQRLSMNGSAFAVTWKTTALLVEQGAKIS
jgi:hypothetical protein